MNNRQAKMALLISATLIISLTGCTTQRQIENDRKQIFKGSSPMNSILRGGNSHSSPKPSYRQVPDWTRNTQDKKFIPAGYRNNEDYTRNQAKELNGLFPRLPNPDLVMYVFPHLSSEQATVPGYSSQFPLYKTNQYALPGEMSAIWQIR